MFRVLCRNLDAKIDPRTYLSSYYKSDLKILRRYSVPSYLLTKLVTVVLDDSICLQEPWPSDSTRLLSMYYAIGT